MSHESGFWILATLLLTGIAMVAFSMWWKKGQRDKAVCIGLTFIFLCGALYFHLGNPFLINFVVLEQNLWAKKVVRIEELQAKAAKEGLSPEEWAELGEIQTSAENYHAAADAYKQAVITSNGSAEYILLLGKNLMFAEEGTVTEEAREAFAMATALAPHPEAEFYLAVYDVQQGNNAGAKERFQNLVQHLPQGMPLRAMAQKQLHLLDE